MKEPITYLETPSSFNNRLIVEVYKKEAMRSKEVNGFAFVDQKFTLKGLKVLVDAKLSDGTFIKRGSIAYIKEEALHGQQWAQKHFETSFLQEPFLIVDMNNVEFIEPGAHTSYALGILPVSTGGAGSPHLNQLTCPHHMVIDSKCTVCGAGVYR